MIQEAAKASLGAPWSRIPARSRLPVVEIRPISRP